MWCKNNAKSWYLNSGSLKDINLYIYINLYYKPIFYLTEFFLLSQCTKPFPNHIWDFQQKRLTNTVNSSALESSELMWYLSQESKALIPDEKPLTLSYKQKIIKKFQALEQRIGSAQWIGIRWLHSSADYLTVTKQGLRGANLSPTDADALAKAEDITYLLRSWRAKAVVELLYPVLSSHQVPCQRWGLYCAAVFWRNRHPKRTMLSACFPTSYSTEWDMIWWAWW